MTKMNVQLQIYKIQQYLADHGLDPESIDVAAEIDRTLSLPENIKNIAGNFGITIEKEPGADDYCLFLQEKCELDCDAESCEMFDAEKCAGTVEPCPVEKEGRGKIFCYRDLLVQKEEDTGQEEEEEDITPHKKKHQGQSVNYGITLYFIEGMFGAKKPAGVSIIFLITDLIAGFVKPERAFDIGRDIEKILSKNAPIVSFVRMCINANTGKTRCYNDARAAGIAIRKQTQLALYEFLKGETKIKPGVFDTITPDVIPPAIGFFESVRDFFRDELLDDQWFGQFEYIESELSECDAGDITTADEINAGDFVFEMGELQSATIKYFGQYHSQRKKLVMRIYPEFDQSGLRALLVKR
jgi:hypothetical protein